VAREDVQLEVSVRPERVFWRCVPSSFLSLTGAGEAKTLISRDSVLEEVLLMGDRRSAREGREKTRERSHTVLRSSEMFSMKSKGLSVP
jgi:hypothetical protein